MSGAEWRCIYFSCVIGWFSTYVHGFWPGVLIGGLIVLLSHVVGYVSERVR